jgi:hypothetical protein
VTSSLIGYTCEDDLPVKINITCLIFIPYKTSADQAVALVYYISASIKIVLKTSSDWNRVGKQEEDHGKQKDNRR